jgi:AraC family transcriptional regulator
METFKKGNYLGTRVDSFISRDIIISKAEYCHIENQYWHCHENPFLAYFLKGCNTEFRKSREIHCSSGTLLFYRSGEPHCNKDYSYGCKIFHIEMDSAWFERNDIRPEKIQVDVIHDLLVKNAVGNIICEFAIRDELSGSSIESMLVYLFNSLTRSLETKDQKPEWTKKFNTIIARQVHANHSLKSIARILNIHPVTLSKEFPRYYHCTFGEHIRQLRIEESLSLLSKKNMPLNEIAWECGFSDTSNYIRSFKKAKGLTPGYYRKLL